MRSKRRDNLVSCQGTSHQTILIDVNGLAVNEVFRATSGPGPYTQAFNERMLEEVARKLKVIDVPKLA